MPRGLEIHTHRINQLLDHLGIDYLFEIDRLEQPKPHPQHLSGGHTATMAAVFTEVEKSSIVVRQAEHKIVIKIDFDGLARKARYETDSAAAEKLLFSQLVEDSFRGGVESFIAQELGTDLERDCFYVFGGIFSLLILSGASELLAAEQADAPTETAMLVLIVFLISMMKLFISTYYVASQLRQNDHFRAKVEHQAAIRSAEQDMSLEDAHRQAINVQIAKEVFSVPLLLSTKRLITLIQASADHYLSHQRLFRSSQ